VVQEYLHSYNWIQVKQSMDDLHLLYSEMSMMQEIVGVCATSSVVSDSINIFFRFMKVQSVKQQVLLKSWCQKFTPC
jgi:hypothetical protein